MTGTVGKIFFERGFGFVSRDDGRKDLFFHFRKIGDALTFSEQLTGLRVEFEIVETEKGPEAWDLRPV